MQEIVYKIGSGNDSDAGGNCKPRRPRLASQASASALRSRLNALISTPGIRAPSNSLTVFSHALSVRTAALTISWLLAARFHVS